MVKKLEDYEWMCPEPFTNFMTSPVGNYLPCCASRVTEKELKRIKLNKYYFTNKDSYFDFYNSELMKKLRYDMKNNNKSEVINTYCQNCILQEKSGVKSHRKNYLDLFYNELKHKKLELEKIIEEEKKPSFFHSAEINSLVGNLCNLSCNTCNSYLSSRYASEEVKLNETKNKNILLVNNDSEIFNSDLEYVLQNLVELKLTGGEPLLSKKIERLLNKALSINKNIKLYIITNGTVNPDNFIKLLKQFKDVKINISLDGPKKINDYIRYPSKFKNIINNYDKFNNYFDTGFVGTISALSIGNLHLLPNEIGNRKYSHSSIVTDNFYSVNSIPNDIKEEYLNSLYINQKKDLIKILENSKFNELEMWKMLSHIKRRDKIRNKNMINVLPEWKKYYENCSG